MIDEYYRIFRQLFDAPVFDGGWARDPRRRQPSVTVTSEVMLAVFEYLAQVPDPSPRSEMEILEQRLSAGDRLLRAAIKTRSAEPNGLDAYNCALALAAHLGFRAYLARIGQEVEDPDEQFLRTATETFVSKLGQTSGQLGTLWASIKGLQQARRCMIERRDDPAVKFLQEKTSFAFAETALRERVQTELTRFVQETSLPQTEPASAYRACIVLDLALSSAELAGNSPAAIEIAAKEASLACLRLRLPIRADLTFPLEWLRRQSNSNADRLGIGEYEVVTPAALLLSLAKVVSVDGPISNADTGFSARLFYMVADGVRRNPTTTLNGERIHEVAHVLRALMTCQLHERDARNVIDLMRLAEEHRLELQRQQTLANFDLLFGRPGQLWFLAASITAWTVILLWLTFLFAVTLIGSAAESDWTVRLAAAVGLATVCTVPAWAVYARMNRFDERPAREKPLLLLNFFLGGAWLLIPLALATLLGWFDVIFGRAQ